MKKDNLLVLKKQIKLILLSLIIWLIGGILIYIFKFKINLSERHKCLAVKTRQFFLTQQIRLTVSALENQFSNLVQIF